MKFRNGKYFKKFGMTISELLNFGILPKFRFKLFKPLIAKNPTKNRFFLNTATTTPSLIRPLFSPSPSLSSQTAKWISPFQGPLFLSFTPWKLFQSATSLHFNENSNCSVVLRKDENFSINLHLLRRRARLDATSQLERSRRVEDTADENAKNGLTESFVNWPNFISVSRLASGPFIGWMITHQMYSYAFVALAVSGATDWLDGYVARKMKIDSVVGSYLDPLPDKVLIGSVALAMVCKALLHPGLVVLRDVALVGGAVYHRGSSLGWKWSNWYDFFNVDGTIPEKIEPLFISKVNKVFQLLLVAAALLQPEFGTDETQLYITYLSWLVAVTTVASTGAHGAQYMKNRSALLAKKSLF